MRIHIFGASGSGTTTLGKALASNLCYPHYDTDDYFWMRTEPLFQIIQERSEREKLLRHDLEKCRSWVLSGSLFGWGNFAVPVFDLVVFLWLPPVVRMERLKRREIVRYGASIESPDNPNHKQHKEFLQWAANYDTGGSQMRSKKLHEEWIAHPSCNLIKHEKEQTVSQHLEAIFQSKLFPNTVKDYVTD